MRVTKGSASLVFQFDGLCISLNLFDRVIIFLYPLDPCFVLIIRDLIVLCVCIFWGNVSLGIASYVLFRPTLFLIWAFKFMYCICINFACASVFKFSFSMNFPFGKKSLSVRVCAESGSP